MALNTLKCNHLMPLPFKGSKRPTMRMITRPYSIEYYRRRCTEAIN